jgi:2,3-bisphosphoglycerate-independent phosphoglycerate mutase
LKLRGHAETVQASCTPPHDIPGQPIAGYLPRGEGSQFLQQLMTEAKAVLKDHPVNLRRIARGEIPATMIWLFWGSGQIPVIPSFQEVYGLKAAITSGVDLLRGLGQMMGMTVLDIPGVTDNMQNDFTAQADGALAALKDHDLVVIHVEAPDEAGHAGNLEEKVAAIERTDELVVSRLRGFPNLKIMVMPDHPTPVAAKTHVAEPVPCLMRGGGLLPNHAERFNEVEAGKTGFLENKGYNMMKTFVKE